MSEEKDTEPEWKFAPTSGGGYIHIFHKNCSKFGTRNRIGCGICGKPIPNHLLIQLRILNSGKD